MKLSSLWMWVVLGSCAASMGCAAFTATPRTSAAVHMHSPPPEPREDIVRHLDRGQAWVPGYFEPAFGVWTWHPGHVIEDRPGYRVAEARYIEKDGEYHVQRPYWTRTGVATRN
jgi:hypothetical protein